MAWRVIKLVRLWAWCIIRQSGGWLLYALWRLARCLVCAGRRSGQWLHCQLLAPCLCFGCIYIGVVLTLLLPTSLWAALVPANIAGLVVPSFGHISLEEGFDIDHVRKALLAALPLALHVFRYGYVEWKTSLDPLGARILYACAVGVTWPKIWFRRKQRQLI